MKKNTKNALSLVQPMLAVIVVTVAVPLLTHAATVTDRDLFNGQNFRTQVRTQNAKRNGVAVPIPVAKPQQSQSSVNPCTAVSSSASSASSVTKLDFYRDLTTAQQSDLRRQLRSGACPYSGADPAYTALCLDLLGKEGVFKETRVGPRSPRQTEEQFKKSGGDIGQ